MKYVYIARQSSQSLLFVAFAFLLVAGCKTKKPLLESPHDVRTLEEAKRLPIEVSSIRDGKTTIIKNKSNNSKFDGICFVRSSDVKVGGDIYTIENWRDTNAMPLSISNARVALTIIEKTLKEFYGEAEIKRIISNRLTIINLTDEEMAKYIIDPKLSDELDATYALDLISEFREYLEMREKSIHNQ